MNKFLIAMLLIMAVIIAGCVQETSPAGNNTTAGEKIKIPGLKTPGLEKVKFASEDIVRGNLNKSEAVKLFLGLYPAAELSLTKAAAPYTMWAATYLSGGKNLTINLNATSGETVSSNIQIEYLRSGKYCKVSEDCVNIGDLNSAMCINNIYAAKEGTLCDGSRAGCAGSIQCCTCLTNYCVKKEVQLSAASCPSGTGTNGSNAAAAGGRSVSCSSIAELTTGQKVISGNKTLEFNGIYDAQGGDYSAKFTVKSESDSATKYIKVKTKEYIAAGITISVNDAIVPVGGGSAIASLTISGMGNECAIGTIK